MSNSSESNVLITFEGRTMSLETALKTTREGLAGTGAEANATGDKLAKMSESEAKTAHEARNMGEAVKVAADTVGLLGIESGESYIRLQSLRHGVTDFTASMGGLKAGLVGGIGLGAAFGGIQFLHEAVVDSIAGEQATNQLQAALRKTPGAFQETNRAIEESSTTWAKFGISVGVLKAAVAQGVGAGINPETIIGQPGKIADLAKALGEDVPTALGEIERGGRGAQRVISRLNLSLVDQRRAMQELANPNMSANDRTQYLLNRVQQTAFAGQGAAGTKGAQGQIAALDASLADLKETVGTSLLPVLTDMVSTFTGMIQGANSMLSAVGGLSTFLQATWKPALIGISTIFLGLKISHSALGDFIRSRLLGDVSAASGGVAEEAVQATKASDAIGSIPPVVRTIAMFDAAGASGLKDLYLANLSRIPGALIPGLAITPQPVTVPAFVPTGAEANLAHYEGELATIPRAIPTTTSFVAGAIPVLAVTAVATVGTMAVMDGALKPVTDALGNLTGHVTSLVEDATAPAVNVTGHVASWVYDTPIAPSSIVEHVKGWVLDTPFPDPAAVSAHVASWIIDALPNPAAVPGHIGSWILNTPLPDPKAVSAHVGQWIFDSLPGTVENLTGSIKHWYTSPGPSLKDLTATITHWAFGGDAKKGVTVPGTATVDKVAVKTGALVSIDKGTIAHISTPKNTNVSIDGTATFTHVGVPAGSTITVDKVITGSNISVPKGTTVHIAGNATVDGVEVVKGKTFTISNVHGTAIIDNAMVAPGKKLSVGNVGGTAIISNVIPAPGKKLTISGVTGSAQVDGLTLKRGGTITTTGGSATLDTINAKGLTLDAAAMANAVGFGKNHPLPLYFKPELAPGAKWPTGPGASGGSSGGGGGGGTDWTGMIESAVIFQVVGALVGKGGSAGISKIKGLFDDSKGPKPPSSGGSSGSVDAELSLLEQDAQAAERKAKADAVRTRAQKPASPAGRTLTPPPPVVTHPEPARPGSVPARKPASTTPSWAQNLNSMGSDAAKKIFSSIINPLVYDFGQLGNLKNSGFAQYTIKLAGAFVGFVGAAVALVGGLLQGGPTGAGATIFTPQIKTAIALQMGQFASGLIGGIGTGIKIKISELTAIGGQIIEAIKAGLHIPGVTNGTGGTPHPNAPKADPGTGITDRHGHKEVTSGGNYYYEDPHHPGKFIRDGQAPPHRSGNKGVFMSLPADMASGMNRVTAHHAPVVHHTTHQQVTHHTTVTNNVTVNESKTPRATGDAVLKALSAAAQRKAKHGR